MLKIDRTFVSAAQGENGSSALISGIVEIGRKLGLRTLAEGIESAEQLETLRDSGCQLGQGFLFAHPVPESEVIPALQRLARPSRA